MHVVQIKLNGGYFTEVCICIKKTQARYTHVLIKNILKKTKQKFISTVILSLFFSAVIIIDLLGIRFSTIYLILIAGISGFFIYGIILRDKNK